MKFLMLTIFTVLIASCSDSTSTVQEEKNIKEDQKTLADGTIKFVDVGFGENGLSLTQSASFSNLVVETVSPCGASVSEIISLGNPAQGIPVCIGNLDEYPRLKKFDITLSSNDGQKTYSLSIEDQSSWPEELKLKKSKIDGNVTYDIIGKDSLLETINIFRKPMGEGHVSLTFTQDSFIDDVKTTILNDKEVKVEFLGCVSCDIQFNTLPTGMAVTTQNGNSFVLNHFEAATGEHTVRATIKKEANSDSSASLELRLVIEQELAEMKPDLIVTDLYFNYPYVYTKYKNIGGSGQGDFLIKTSTDRGSFPGNSFYRFPVPPPGEEMTTGGLTIGLIGYTYGENPSITASIDWEGRVDERNETNNNLTKTVKLGEPIGNPSLTKSKISLPVTSLKSGEATTVTLTMYDDLGRRINTGGIIVNFLRMGGTSTLGISSTTDNADGTYSANLEGVVAGTPTTISAYINGDSLMVQELPNIHVTPGDLVLPNSTFTLSNATIDVQASTELKFCKRDIASNIISDGDDTVIFVDENDTDYIEIGEVSKGPLGCYVATLTGKNAGSTAVGVVLNGNASYQDKAQINVEGSGINYQNGISDIFTSHGYFYQLQYSLQKWKDLSGFKVFSSGPHSDLNIAPYNRTEHGHYNPEFLQWLLANSVPSASSGVYFEIINGLYTSNKLSLQNYLRNMYWIKANPALYDDFKQQYQAGITVNPNSFHPHYYIYVDGVPSYDKRAISWWVRRDWDGTNALMEDLFVKFFEKVDPAYLTSVRN